MKIAKVCDEWKLTFNKLESENDVSLHNRSYLHYAADHQDLVASKAWATKWLLDNIVDNSRSYSVREYMAGIGIQTLLIQKLLNVNTHTIGELDNDCIDHLKSNEWSPEPIYLHQNAFEAAKENDHSDLKFLDVPSSSILQMTTKWKDIFFKLFESSPTLVVWTDTSVTYPMTIHGEKYGKILSAEIRDKYEYVNAYSAWLFRNFGYSIKRAAFRGTNAVYFAAVKGMLEPEMKSFPLAENTDGFYFIGEEKNTLDNFF